MRIDTGSSYWYSSQSVRHQTSDQGASMADSIVTSSTSDTDASGVRKIDFSNMTRGELRDWTNTQIKNGDMSLDDSLPFMAMTMKIPVGSEYGGELPIGVDTEKINFTQRILDGIDGARSRNDTQSLNMLNSAMSIVQRYQGQAIGVDVRA